MLSILIASYYSIERLVSIGFSFAQAEKNLMKSVLLLSCWGISKLDAITARLTNHHVLGRAFTVKVGANPIITLGIN